ncbi:MAG TPA: hypothetical protein VM118_03150 [Acidobacteriota bacterium]|nr:hypothetical protein [Acidobacteriota bacterium]
MVSESKVSLPLTQLQVDPKRGLVYGLVGECNDEWTLIRSNFGAYDYRNRRIEKVWKVNPDTSGRGYYLIAYHLNAERRLLYAAARTPRGYRLVCYDLDREEVVFEFPIPLGRLPRLTPDGKELWIPNYYDENITIYDAEDGEFLDVISLSDYRPLGTHGATPLMIRFLPSGDKAYVTCGSDTPGPLLVIDVQKREVTKAFFVDELRYPVFLDVGPAP